MLRIGDRVEKKQPTVLFNVHEQEIVMLAYLQNSKLFLSK